MAATQSFITTVISVLKVITVLVTTGVLSGTIALLIRSGAALHATVFQYLKDVQTSLACVRASRHGTRYVNNASARQTTSGTDLNANR